MAPKTKRTRRDAEPIEHQPGSGQDADSLAKDLAAQPGLLAAAAELLKRQQAEVASIHADLEPATKKKAKRPRSDILDELLGGLKDGGAVHNEATGDRPVRKDKTCKAALRLAKIMQGPTRGNLSGKVFYTILCAFNDNTALYEVVQKALKKRMKWFPDWGAHAVECPTDKLALIVHNAILNAATLTNTNTTLNQSLDVSLFDNAAVKKYKFHLVKSSSLATEAGVLPPSIMIIGEVYNFKEFLKDRYTSIRYTDLQFDGRSKAAWVLPQSEETEETGTLKQFLNNLGVDVIEVDLDEESDDEPDSSDLVETEAVEASE